MNPAGTIQPASLPLCTTPGWTGKRALDVALALALIVLLLPMFVLVGMAVLITSRGPMLFTQRRVGLGGREFPILKFRTMVPEAEERLSADPELRSVYVNGDFKIPNAVDPRVTPVGRVLRALSLDELPQLFNVLAGHMSLVGPRPIVPAELDLYGDCRDAYLSVRPGLTGLWQVSGRNEIKFPQRAALDAEYAQRCSPAVDLLVLLRTPGAVVRCRGSE